MSVAEEDGWVFFFVVCLFFFFFKQLLGGLSKFYFIFKLYIIVLVLPNIKMNLPHMSFFLIFSTFYVPMPCFFFFKLYNIVLVLPNIEMNPPQVYMCSQS